MLGDLAGVVAHLGPAKGRAAGVVGEGVGVAGGVLVGLAQGIVQVQAVVVGQVRTLQGAGHRRQVGRVETVGLEVGQAPPGLAQRRLQVDGLAVGGHAVVGAADGLEGVAIAHPALGCCG
jgi:hypothetical protein